MDRHGYIDVDQIQAQTSLEEAAAKCGFSLDIKGSGTEIRIDCPFGCAGDHLGRKEIAINTANAQKVFQCHAYSCKFRGNLLTLMHGFLAATKPTGDKLKGAEFHRIKNLLAGIAEVVPGKSQSTPHVPVQSHAAQAPIELSGRRNVALIDSLDQRVRELHDIDTKLVTDISRMNPSAASYVRRHPTLTPETMKKWRCGYLPNDGGGDKRGWSLRGNFVYPILSESGKVLAWAGRDVTYEIKESEFAKTRSQDRSGKSGPIKHRFPKGFHRGLELFGQHSNRLAEPGFREFLTAVGLIVVEGFNDVIRLDSFGIPSVALMSNRITNEQIHKLTGWSKQLGVRSILVMLDNDEGGVEGAKDAFFRLGELGVNAQLVWTPKTHGGAFVGRQPESLTAEEIQLLGWPYQSGPTGAAVSSTGQC